MQSVGFTTTIPVEILLAAHRAPVDLNNAFITNPQRLFMLEEAEVDGFPRNICGWIKGIYRATLQMGLTEIIAVTQGDCSNTHALMEVLQDHGITVIPFAFPYDRNRADLTREIHKLMDRFGVAEEDAEKVRRDLEPLRRLLIEVDRMTWEDGKVTGSENHYFLVQASDFGGNPDAFTVELRSFISEAKRRPKLEPKLRLAYLGVPPIFDDFYLYLEKQGAAVIFNETQRQFAMPYASADLTDQYLSYTYPYNIFHRLEDIKLEATRRRPDGYIHYVQAFCYRQVEDLLLRKYLDRPFFTMEGDKPTVLDLRSKMRLEGFLQMLKHLKGK